MIQILVAALLSAFLAASAHAQEPDRTYRVGMLTGDRPYAVRTRREMLARLERLGFSARNLVVEVRTGPRDEIPGLARDLAVRSDVIVVLGDNSVILAGQAVRTVPIVTLGVDPTAVGLAQSLSRPGGNVTGIALSSTELNRKRVELLHEAVPTARRIAVLTGHASVVGPGAADLITAMANAGVDVRLFYADNREEYPAAFAAMREAGMEALLIDEVSRFSEDTAAAQLQALALEARLPTVCPDAFFVRVGCMLSYGWNFRALRVRLGDYVARILRGASPAEMPIERDVQFEVTVNLRTARALGLTLPQAILVRADEVIE